MILVKIDIRGLNVGEEAFNDLKRKYPYFIDLKTGTDKIVEEIEINVPSSFERADEILWKYLVENYFVESFEDEQCGEEKYFLVSLFSEVDVSVADEVEEIIKAQLSIVLCQDSTDECLSGFMCKMPESSKAMHKLFFLRQCLINLEEEVVGFDEDFLLKECLEPILRGKYMHNYAKRNGKIFDSFYLPVIERRPLNKEEKEELQTTLDDVRSDSERKVAIFCSSGLVLTGVTITGFVCFFVLDLPSLVSLGLAFLPFVAAGVDFGAHISVLCGKTSLNVCDQIEHRFLEKKGADVEEVEDGEAQTAPNLTWCGFFKRVLTQRVRPQQTNTLPVLEAK